MGRKGVFITFEGGEGSGKSTQARVLAERLQELGRPVLLTREPGGTEGAEIMRELLLSGALEPFGSEIETLVLYAARADHLDTRIKPAIDEGKWVICDRFSDSTRAYQGAADKVSPKLIKSLDKVVVGASQPDVTFLLDIPAENGLARARLRAAGTAAADRFEKADLGFHERLREGFLEIAAQEPHRLILINAARPIEDIADEIWASVQSRFADRLKHDEAENIEL